MLNRLHENCEILASEPTPEGTRVHAKVHAHRIGDYTAYRV